MIARRLLLRLSTNAWLREHATKTAFVRRSVSAFMPGERLEDAMAAASAQQTNGVGAIFTKLGENLSRAGDAEAVTDHYLDVLDQIARSSLRAEISVKPTQLGLDFDRTVCLTNLRRLVDRADARSGFVWIDMEGSPYVDRTLELLRSVRDRSPRVGVALQAYLYRTAKDLESLLASAASVRIVKGAYLEPPSIAYQQKADVDRNFFELSRAALGVASRVHIATHDAILIERLSAFIEQRQIPAAAYEYAMLYGIQRPLQQRLVAADRPLRVLIAYGDYWFPWYMRRLAERPANVWFVVKNLF